MHLFPDEPLVVGLLLALASACAFNWSWVAQHTVTSRMPPLSVRRPFSSLRLLFGNRRWLFAFMVGLCGWALYIWALALAPLSLVQAVSAGGLGLLALFAQRASGERLPGREWIGVGLAVLGLVLLAGSLAGGSTDGEHGAWAAVAAWFVVSVVLAALALGPGGRWLAPGAGFGLAAGLFYAAADVGTKAAVDGGTFLLLTLPIWICHVCAFTTIQLGFQRGRALATAGLSSFLTNALPIVGGIVVYHEELPGGALGALRAVAFACVVAGAVAVAWREADAERVAPEVESAPEADVPPANAVPESQPV
jgi:hypothetical protein